MPLLNSLRLILVNTRFPENIGSAARASANFGHAPLYLVNPERWDLPKAAPLATAQGLPLLEQATVLPTLAEAVAPCTLVMATTARVGGWRRQLLSPRQAANLLAAHLNANEEVALVFGPEDRGLENHHLEHCTHLIHIPTAPEASSLNLAQAVLLMLYECFLALPEQPASKTPKGELSRRVTQEERELFFTTFKQTLLDIHFLQPDNPDYFFLPLARFFHRADLRRHEMDLFMGLCRQIKNGGRCPPNPLAKG